MERVITAIDLGTTKFFGLVGVVSENGIDIRGIDIKQTEEDWIKSGRIGNLEGVAGGLIDLVDSLKKQSKEKIEWVTFSVGGGHIFGKIYAKKVEILPKGRQISKVDIQNLEKEIRNLVVPELEGDREIICIVPQDYVIDNNYQGAVEKPPIGMHGNILEMRAHILTGEINPLRDLNKCANMVGLKVSPNIFPHSWASAEAVINEEEKKLGCLLIDIGKNTTDYVFYSEGKIILTESLKIGSYLVDKDLSMKFHTTIEYAEELKKKYARCDYKNLIEEKREEIKKVEIYNPSGITIGRVSIDEISQVVYLRMREIFEIIWELIQRRVIKSGKTPYKISEVVLTGGGAKLQGIEKLAEEVFQIPTRIGVPLRMFNLDPNYQKPEFSSGIGLLLLASKVAKIEEKGIWRKIKEWFSEMFFSSS